MRKSISPKLRFQVLNRDDHECKYCGLPAGKGVQLQVDHVVPVKEGGNNSISNLITSCFECNVGKGGKTPEVHTKDLYKTKIEENTKKHLDNFFSWWNENKLGEIDRNTIALLSILHTEYLGKDSYLGYIDGPGVKSAEKRHQQFLIGGDVCDEVLKDLYGPFSEDDAFNINMERLLDDDRWKNECKDDMNNRLNYIAGEYLYESYSEGCLKNDYSIRKYCYFYNEIKNG